LNTPYPLIVASSLFMVLYIVLVLFPDLNIALFYAINKLAGSADAIVWLNITHLGDGLLLACLAIILLSKNRSHLAAAMISSLLLAIVMQIIKRQLQVDRPPFALDTSLFYLLITDLKPTDFALPSGHTAGAFALATMAWATHQKRSLCIAAFGIATIVAISRIIVGVHWPTDIALGAVTGMVSILILFAFLPHRLKNMGVISVSVLYLFCATCAVILLFQGTRLSEYTSITIVNGFIGTITLITVLKGAYTYFKARYQANVLDINNS